MRTVQNQELVLDTTTHNLFQEIIEDETGKLKLQTENLHLVDQFNTLYLQRQERERLTTTPEGKSKAEKKFESFRKIEKHQRVTGGDKRFTPSDLKIIEQYG